MDAMMERELDSKDAVYDQRQILVVAGLLKVPYTSDANR
jgi:hypothetical protein